MNAIAITGHAILDCLRCGQPISRVRRRRTAADGTDECYAAEHTPHLPAVETAEAARRSLRAAARRLPHRIPRDVAGPFTELAAALETCEGLRSGRFHWTQYARDLGDDYDDPRGEAVCRAAEDADRAAAQLARALDLYCPPARPRAARAWAVLRRGLHAAARALQGPDGLPMAACASTREGPPGPAR